MSKTRQDLRNLNLEVYCNNNQPKLKELRSSTSNQSFLMASGGFLKFIQYWLIIRALTHLGLDRTGHMSLLTEQDRTPKFARQVLPDRTESGLLFLKHFTCQAGDHKISKFPGHMIGVKNAHRQDKERNKRFVKKFFEKNIFFWNFFWFFFY